MERPGRTKNRVIENLAYPLSKKKRRKRQDETKTPAINTVIACTPRRAQLSGSSGLGEWTRWGQGVARLRAYLAFFFFLQKIFFFYRTRSAVPALTPGAGNIRNRGDRAPQGPGPRGRVASHGAEVRLSVRVTRVHAETRATHTTAAHVCCRQTR